MECALRSGVPLADLHETRCACCAVSLFFTADDITGYFEQLGEFPRVLVCRECYDRQDAEDERREDAALGEISCAADHADGGR